MRGEGNMLRRTALIIVILLASALIGTQAYAQDEGKLSEVKEIPCPVKPALDEIEGETVICGTVTVPEDYDKPDGTQIELAFALLKSDSLSPAPDPVIYLHGGPGAAELKDLAKMSERFAPIRQSRDVVIFDQRGTGHSPGPLTCDVEYATQQDDIRAYVEEYAKGNVNVDSAVNRALFAGCLDLFESTGADLSQYNTINNARDVVELASALGYEDKINLYGFSYGTQVALEAMRQHPERLRSVVLDSVAPASIKLYENMGQPNVEAITSLLAICSDDEDCNEAYPDLRQRFEALLTKLDQEPLRREDGSEVIAATVVSALRQNDIRPGLATFIPRMIWELEQGKLDTLDEILAGRLPPPPLEEIDPLTLRYVGLDLEEDTVLLVKTALDLREEARDLAEIADRLVMRGDERIASHEFESDIAGRFDRLVHELIDAQPFDRQLALNEAYLAFPINSEGRTVEGLKAFIEANFGGTEAVSLSSLAEQMTDADVEVLAEIILGKARTYATYFNVSLALHLYACQEHVPYNNMEGALATFEALEIQQVARGKWGTVTGLMANCELFPMGQEPEGFHDPVESDIPALILAGTADTQTATSWGLHAAETLENSQVVILPETGHGAIRFSQCAKDIGAAFFGHPEGEVNTECTKDLLPIFASPAEEPAEED
jgi:pimeloyl-ACP methyl ester carboxylesterase